MPRFSNESLTKLEQAHPRLQRICHRAIEVVDFTVLETHRSVIRQKALLDAGKTKTPNSLHCRYPSEAIDIAPYPLDWDDTKRFIYLAGVMAACAFREGAALRWGGNWDGDLTIIDDQDFDDLVHYELL